MLVLARKLNETIVIGDKSDPNIGFEIRIVIVEVDGDKVRLGIEAPKSVPVWRKEIFDMIKKNAANAVAKHNNTSGFNPLVRVAQ